MDRDHDNDELTESAPERERAEEAASKRGTTRALEDGIVRREFLRLAGAAVVVPAALQAACGDDVLGTESDGASGSDTTGDSDAGTTGSDTTAGPGGTGTGSSGSSTGDDATGGSSDGGTGGSSDGTTEDSVGETTTTGEETTGEETTGGNNEECDGEVIAFDPEAVPEDLTTFPVAVMAGAMRTDSALLTTFIDSGEAKILRVWRPAEGDGEIELIQELEVSAVDGYVQQYVDNLCPGTWYSYAYFTPDGDAFSGRSIIGEFRTAIPDDSLEPLVLAASACNGYGNRPWPALQVTADEYYDMFVHLGDMVYADGSTSLADFRQVWRDYLAVEDGGQPMGLARAFSRAGMYATLDDHEVDNNFNPENYDPQELENAMQAWFEIIPLEGADEDYKVWRSYRWGLTAEIIVLDCRTERLPSTQNGPNAQYISPEQLEFLKDRLKNSPCHFKIVLNSVPITNMPFVWDFAANDRWEGYAAQRDEVLNFIADEDIANVWFISGDFHVCFVSYIEPNGAGVVAKTREIAMTGGNTNILGETLGGDQYDYGAGSPRGCLMTFDPVENEVLVRFLDPDNGQDVYAEVLSQDN